MKLLVRIRERVKIVYITIVFVSVLVSFIIAAILAHVTWALAWEWAFSIRTAKNSYIGACLGHYGMSS